KLNRLNGLIKRGLGEAGIKLEDRLFRPHLTLGRIKHLKPGNSLKDLIEKYSDADLQVVPVNEIILFESILLHDGPVYKPISKFKI
ncbi:MAG: RNA 2',3'-cyclic phosphodiesterase, partial [Bacteroidetes bacterium]